MSTQPRFDALHRKAEERHLLSVHMGRRLRERLDDVLLRWRDDRTRRYQQSTRAPVEENDEQFIRAVGELRSLLSAIAPDSALADDSIRAIAVREEALERAFETCAQRLQSANARAAEAQRLADAASREAESVAAAVKALGMP